MVVRDGMVTLVVGESTKDVADGMKNIGAGMKDIAPAIPTTAPAVEAGTGKCLPMVMSAVSCP
jgi:hypothetical protein